MSRASENRMMNSHHEKNQEQQQRKGKKKRVQQEIQRDNHAEGQARRRVILSPLSKIRPMCLIEPCFTLTSEALSKTTFIYSSKPMIVPCNRKTGFSYNQISTRVACQKKKTMKHRKKQKHC